MSDYTKVPYLLKLEGRKGILPYTADEIPKDLLRRTIDHLKQILLGTALPPSDPRIFYIEAFIVASSNYISLKSKWLDYYTSLSMQADEETIEQLRTHYDAGITYDIKTFLLMDRDVEGAQLFYQEVVRGTVHILNERPILINRLRRDMEHMLESISKNLHDEDRKVFQELAENILPKPRTKGARFYRQLLSLEGLQDGRKRILYYWLIPYLVTIERRPREDAIRIATEWVQKQEGARRISVAWIRSEVNSVANRGIKPWSKRKVAERDPQLVEILKEKGIEI